MKTWQRLRENPELWEKYLIREKVVDTIRGFFKSRGFREMFTPTLVAVPSIEPNLEVFESELRTAGGKKAGGFLILSPEFSLKKLIAAGSGNVFEIARCFRNEEEVSTSHNPEFSMLEWYRVGADYKKIMDDFEELFIDIAGKVRTGETGGFDYLGEKYDLSRPWSRISVSEAFDRFAGIDTDTMLDADKLGEVFDKKGYKRNGGTSWEEMFYQIFFNEIEPRLKESRRPTFVYDYPAAQASLSRRKRGDGRFAERFEVYMAGLELGNCFSELTDATEQRTRFEQDAADREKNGKTRYPIDEDLLAALSSGMPETAGIAVGVDRLVMLLANVPSISETMLFPAEEMFGLKEN